jgi:hypothetical protein
VAATYRTAYVLNPAGRDSLQAERFCRLELPTSEWCLENSKIRRGQGSNRVVEPRIIRRIKKPFQRDK